MIHSFWDQSEVSILYFPDKFNQSKEYWNYSSKSAKMKIYKNFKHELLTGL